MSLLLHRSFLMQSIQQDLHKLCDVLQHPDVEVSVCGLRVLSVVGVPASADTSVLSHLSSVVVSLLFRVLWCRVEKGDNPSEWCFLKLSEQRKGAAYVLSLIHISEPTRR